MIRFSTKKMVSKKKRINGDFSKYLILNKVIYIYIAVITYKIVKISP